MLLAQDSGAILFPAPMPLCHPELAIEASFEVLAPQTSKAELALQA